MAILDNIQSLESYGLKYQLSIGGRSRNSFLVEIYKKDYSGDVEFLLGTGDPFQYQQSFVDGDIFRPIAGSQYRLSIISREINYYSEFRYASSRDYYMKFYKKGSTNIIQGCGYLIPENYEQIATANLNVINLSFSDGLGFLKDMDFKNNDGSSILGIEKISDIISFLFWKIGCRALWWVDAIPIRPRYAENEAAGMLFNSYVNCYRFRGMTCEQVLTDILSSLMAQVTQYKETFMIRIPDFPVISWASTIGRTGALVNTAVSFSKELVVGEDIKLNQSVSLRVETPINNIEVTFIQELVDNLLENVTPQAVQDPATYPAWNPTAFPNQISQTLVVIAPYIINQISGSPYYRTPRVDFRFDTEFPHSRGWIEIEVKVKLMTYKENPTRTQATVYFGIRKDSSWQHFWGEPIIGFNSEKTIKKTLFLENSATEDPLYFSALPATPDDANDLWAIQITDWRVTAVQNQQGAKYPEENKQSIAINPDNPKDFTVDKAYGHNSIYPWTDRSPYVFRNNLISKLSGEYEVIRDCRFKSDFQIIRLKDFVMDRYLQYYSLNKLRVNAKLISQIYEYEDGWITSFTTIRIPGLDQNFLVSSFNWSAKGDEYDVELIGYVGLDWILETGSWNDTGIWIDTEYWDEP